MKKPIQKIKQENSEIKFIPRVLFVNLQSKINKGNVSGHTYLNDKCMGEIFVKLIEEEENIIEDVVAGAVRRKVRELNM